MPKSKKRNPHPVKRIRRWLRPLKPIRAAVREETAGGVVWRRNPKGEIEFLMIQDSKHRWTVPKGHVEKGERLADTAVREIYEEAGLKNVKVLDYLGKTNFRYRRDDKLILMTQHMYLIKAMGDTRQIKKEKWMKGIRWFSKNEAINDVEYEDIQKLFLLALRRIRDGGY